MGLKSELVAAVNGNFTDKWDVQTTVNVPGPTDLRLDATHAKDLETATVLYADLDGSTSMVDSFKWWFSAGVYKSYLRCAAAIIRSEGGVVTAYDGDRVMAVFTGATKNTDAVRAALKINYAVHEIVRPAIKAKYPTAKFTLDHVIGIDTSQLRAARIGVKGDNDVVWVGRAANYAAKLCSESGKPIWITETVFKAMQDTVKVSNGVPMWTSHYSQKLNQAIIYGSTYYQSF